MNATGAVVAHQRPAPAGVQLVERILTNDQIRVLRAALGGVCSLYASAPGWIQRPC
ncbi:hypothetical protein [Pseudomonas aeruginosa]|uniref:hypothetical protein n=1 Tax=Pseudomonas aeruginosa TaxID=287 RepID=UPI000B17B9D1|nr:hypothetical protein [Pseudomonas aeruginosa]